MFMNYSTIRIIVKIKFETIKRLTNRLNLR